MTRMKDATTRSPLRWNVGEGRRGVKQHRLIHLLVVLSLFVMLAVLCQHAFFVLDLGLAGEDESVRNPTIPTIPNTDRRRTINTTTTTTIIPLSFPLPNQNNQLLLPDTDTSTTFFKHETKSHSTAMDTPTLPTSFSSSTTAAAAASVPKPSSAYYTCILHNRTRHPTRIQLPLMKRHFIIAGAQKSGTSALYYFLRQHPNLQASKGLETHFFDWYYPSTVHKPQWMADRNLTTESEFQCAIKQAYWEMLGSSSRNSSDSTTTTTTNNKNETTSFTSRDWNSIITFEKTPSYFVLDRIPQLISSTFSSPPFQQPKIIIILRNPIDRAFSHWKMAAARKGGGKGKGLLSLSSFEESVVQEVQSLRALGLTHAPPFVWPPPSQQATTTSTTSSNINNNKAGNNHTNLSTTDSLLLESFSFQNLVNLSKSESDAAHWKHYRKMFSHNYLQRSMYSTQLERWIQYFPLLRTTTPHNNNNHHHHHHHHQSLLQVIQYERFLSHPDEVVQDLLTFVGVSSPTTSFVPSQGGFHVHFDSKGRPVSPPHTTKTKNNTTNMTLLLPDVDYSLSNETRHYLSLFFQPYNSKLADLLGEDWRDAWV
jgi:hypothetical protein